MNSAHRFGKFLLLLCLTLLVSGCGGSFSSRMINSLSTTILKQNDPDTVRDGAPAYLLLTDGLISDDPRNVGLLQGGARLYSAYAAVFVDDHTRAGKMSTKALNYAWRALCSADERSCGMRELSYDKFVFTLNEINKDNIEQLYILATVWVGWIQFNRGDWRAIAELAKAQAIMLHVLELNEAHDNGGPHLYLGILNALRPAALGGNPGESKKHFERAIFLTQGKDLMMKVMYAKYYARSTFNRALHDRLLKEVINAETDAGTYTLTNVLAQKQAQRLRVEGRKYFID